MICDRAILKVAWFLPILLQADDAFCMPTAEQFEGREISKKVSGLQS